MGVLDAHDHHAAFGDRRKRGRRNGGGTGRCGACGHATQLDGRTASLAWGSRQCSAHRRRQRSVRGEASGAETQLVTGAPRRGHHRRRQAPCRHRQCHPDCSDTLRAMPARFIWAACTERGNRKGACNRPDIRRRPGARKHSGDPRPSRCRVRADDQHPVAGGRFDHRPAGRDLVQRGRGVDRRARAAPRGLHCRGRRSRSRSRAGCAVRERAAP